MKRRNVLGVFFTGLLGLLAIPVKLFATKDKDGPVLDSYLHIDIDGIRIEIPLPEDREEKRILARSFRYVSWYDTINPGLVTVQEHRKREINEEGTSWRFRPVHWDPELKVKP